MNSIRSFNEIRKDNIVLNQPVKLVAQGAVEVGSSGEQPLMWIVECSHYGGVNFFQKAFKLQTWDFNTYT